MKPQLFRHQSRRDEGCNELRYEFSFPEYQRNGYPAGGLLTLSNTDSGPVIDLWRVDPHIEVRVSHEDPKTGQRVLCNVGKSIKSDLLDALENLLEEFHNSHQDEFDNDHYGDGPDGCSYCAAMEQARAAIAKATAE